MKNIDITTRVVELSYDELSQPLRLLTEKAREATYKSYAPYSNFHVGAAILLDNGEMVLGNNQENAAFPSGTCAERTAAFYAHATYPGAKFVAIAIAARGADEEFVANPISPCGACRQVLLEYEKLAGDNVKVLLCADKMVYEVESVKALLPLAFSEF